MKLQIRVDPSTQRIADVKFKTFGCGSAIASSSYLTELVQGMTLEEAGRIRNTEIAKELCLPPVKRELGFFISEDWLRCKCIGGFLANSIVIVHCSMLAEDAIKSAISNYYTKNPNAKATNLAGTAAPIPQAEASAAA
jgi:NifU-like protein involved in Fe-S cluster formation